MWTYLIILLVIILFILSMKVKFREGFDYSDLLNNIMKIKQTFNSDLSSMNADVYQNGKLANLSNIGMNQYNPNGSYNETLPLTQPSTLSFTQYSQAYYSFISTNQNGSFQDSSGLSMTVYVNGNIEKIPSYITTINALNNSIICINKKGVSPIISQDLLNSINNMPKLSTNLFDNSFCLQPTISNVLQNFIDSNQTVFRNMLQYSSNSNKTDYEDYINLITVFCLGLMSVLYTKYLFYFNNLNKKTYYDRDVLRFNAFQSYHLAGMNICMSFIAKLSIPYYQSGTIVSFNSPRELVDENIPNNIFIQDSNGLKSYLNTIQ
jgi:hypothetical protein